MNKNSIKKYSAFILSLSSILILWEIVSLIICSPLILPSPYLVLKEAFVLIQNSSFWFHFFNTLIRVFVSFLISITLGLFLGLICGKSEFCKYFIELPLSIFRTTPVIAIILISLYWLSSNTLPVFISILMNLPITITAVSQGFSNVKQQQNNMAQLYHFSSMQKLLYIQLPACFSNYKAACISCFGLCWKVIVAGEVLCLPKYGLGSIMQLQQVHLETASVIAITFLMVMCSWFLEKILIKAVGNLWKN